MNVISKVMSSFYYYTGVYYMVHLLSPSEQDLMHAKRGNLLMHDHSAELNFGIYLLVKVHAIVIHILVDD